MPTRRSVEEEPEVDPIRDAGYDPVKHEQGKYGTGAVIKPVKIPSSRSLRALLDKEEEKRAREGRREEVRSWRFWKVGTILDQGQSPQCVGYSWRQFLSTNPNPRADSSPTPGEIYFNAQRLDSIPGENYAGSEVDAGAKYLRQRNILSHYVLSGSAPDIKQFVLTYGCVVVGCTYYNNMVKLDNGGYARPTGGVYGGHAFVVSGYSARRNAFRCVNSWGAGWGRRGRFWVKFDHMAQLVGPDGTSVTAFKR